MSRLASAASWLSVGAGLALLFLPLHGATRSNPTAETLVLLTLVCTTCGLATASLSSRASQWPVLAVGAAAGAAVALAIARVVSPPSPDSEGIQVRFLVAAMDVAGTLLLVWGLRREFTAERRPAAYAALCLASVVILGPILASPNVLDAHHLTPIDPRPIVLYWTFGSALLVLPVVALTTLPGDWFERWWTTFETRAMAVSNRNIEIGLVLVALALAIGFSLYCFGRRPTSSDEIVQLWHARILLAGRLALPPDANPEFFAIDNMIDRPLWMSQFPMGGPAILAIGSAVGAAWLVNPVLTALTALTLYRLCRRVYGEPQARAAAVLFVASPMVLIMGGSQMNHTPSAFLVTLALSGLAAWLDAGDDKPRARWAALIGLAIGVTATIRPLDAVIAAAVIGVVMLDAARRAAPRWKSIAVANAVGAVPVALLLAANWRTTGAPLRFGYEVLWGPNHSLGLHPDPLGVPHTAGRALLLGVRYAMEVNWSVTPWPVPVLLVIALALLLTRTLHKWDALFLALCAAQLAAYAFYFHDGQFAGPRFLFTVVPAMLILAARASFIIVEYAPGAWRRAALVLVPVCIAASWVRPMEPYGVRGIANGFRNTRQELKRDAPPDSLMNTLPRALVFVQEGAGGRLVRRLWALGIARQDAARLLDLGEACSILEAVRAEERRAPSDSGGRLARMEQSIAAYDPAGAGLGPARSSTFKVNAASVMTSACGLEIAHDRRIAGAISYGPMLLRNRFDALGRIGGQVVYVIDLGERNETLRSRFGDRQWFRWEIPAQTRDSQPVLVPYDAGLGRAFP